MEKEKSKNPPRPGWLSRPGWMHHRYFAYYMGLMFFIGGMIHVLDTEVVSTLFKIKGSLFAVIFMGLPASLPSAALYETVHPGAFRTDLIYMMPSLRDILIDCLILLCASILVVVILRYLQRFHRIFKILVYLNFLPHMLYALFLALTLIQRILLPQPPAPVPTTATSSSITQSTCDYAVADGIQIRAMTFYWSQPARNEDDWGMGMSFAHTRFSISTDSGNTRHEFMILFDQTSQCEQQRDVTRTGYFDDQFFWLWTDSCIVLTRDGGQTWRQSTRPVQYGTITNVSFDTSQTGQMSIETSQYDSGNQLQKVVNTLTTIDGGITWKPE